MYVCKKQSNVGLDGEQRGHQIMTIKSDNGIPSITVVNTNFTDVAGSYPFYGYDHRKYEWRRQVHKANRLPPTLVLLYPSPGNVSILALVFCAELLTIISPNVFIWASESKCSTDGYPRFLPGKYVFQRTACLPCQ